MAMLKGKSFLTPNDKGIMGTDDAVSIQNATDAAAAAGINKVVIPCYNKRTNSHVWSICASIRVPSDMMLVLDNCRLELADGFVGQMIRNSLACCDEGKLIAGEQTNIRILGRGEAVLDGKVYDGLSNAPFANTLLYLHNVRDFTVEGIRVVDHRGWGVGLMYCSYGKISNIDFAGEGNVPNQDGIMLRCGCHDLIVENITGYTGNDIISVAAVAGPELEVPYSVMGHVVDVRNIIIKNIKATSCAGNIIKLFNLDGLTLYNVLIESVSDPSADYSKARPLSAVMIGDKDAQANVRKVLPGETKSITVRNVFTRARYGVAIHGSLSSSLLENIHVHGDGECAVGVVGDAVTALSNLLIKGVYYNVEQKKCDGTAELIPAEYAGAVLSFENCEGKGVCIDDVFAHKAAHLIKVSGQVTIDLIGAAVDELGGTPVETDENAILTVKNLKVKGEVNT